MMRKNRIWAMLWLAVAVSLTAAARPKPAEEQWRPGARVLLDAHNCYPYFEWWSDRIDRALSAGTPLAIEQDLLWAKNPRTGEMSSVVSHGAPATGGELGIAYAIPGLAYYGASQREPGAAGVPRPQADSGSHGRVRRRESGFLRPGS